MYFYLASPIVINVVFVCPQWIAIVYFYSNHLDKTHTTHFTTYTNLIRHLWVRAHVYDKKAAKVEMDEKVLIDPSLAGKSREEMGLEPFTCT